MSERHLPIGSGLTGGEVLLSRRRQFEARGKRKAIENMYERLGLVMGGEKSGEYYPY